MCGSGTMATLGSDGTETCTSKGSFKPCGSPLICPTPATGKMSICGQLYDIADMSEFRQTTGSDGAPCTTVTTDGPCALRLDAFDAIDFATHPASAAPLQTGDAYIDNCGRFQFADVPQPSSPFVGLGFDDKDASKAGPGGLTNAVGVAVAFNQDGKANVEAFIATKATTDMWSATSGAPTVAQGINVPIFRAHKCDAQGVCTGDAFAPQAGVQIYKSTLAVPNNDFYFSDTSATAHTTIDTSLTATGANGTGLLTGASVNDMPQLPWTGMGGITDTTNCKWENKAAASLPNVVTFQIYRPTNQVGKTCNQ
jgi:hypothetical protein